MISPSYFESFSSQCCVDKSWYSEVTGSWVGASLSHLLEMLPSSSSLWEHNPGGKEGCGIATFSSGGHTSDSDKGDGRKSPRELSGIYHITSKKRVRTHKMLTGEGQGVSLYKVSMEKVMNISGNINRSEEINPVRELIFNTRFGIDDQNRISGHTTDDFFFLSFLMQIRDSHGETLFLTSVIQFQKRCLNNSSNWQLSGLCSHSAWCETGP